MLDFFTSVPTQAVEPCSVLFSCSSYECVNWCCAVDLSLCSWDSPVYRPPTMPTARLARFYHGLGLVATLELRVFWSLRQSRGPRLLSMNFKFPWQDFDSEMTRWDLTSSICQEFNRSPAEVLRVLEPTLARRLKKRQLGQVSWLHSRYFKSSGERKAGKRSQGSKIWPNYWI